MTDKYKLRRTETDKGIRYEVIRNRDGSAWEYVQSEMIDGHYILTECGGLAGITREVFGVVDEAQPEKVDERLRERAQGYLEKSWGEHSRF